MRTSRTKAFFLGGAVLLVLVATAGLAAAHHSFTAFNMNDQKTVTGNVKKVEWTNPHIWIWIDVPGANGASTITDFEGMSPNFLERRGWTRTTLKAGDKITGIVPASARREERRHVHERQDGKRQGPDHGGGGPDRQLNRNRFI